MFGYIKTYQPELKMKDYETYRGVYCSLCKQLGHDYGIFARLTLNYDFTLLALTRLAFADDCCGFENSHCSFRLSKKCLKCKGGGAELGFAAAAAMIMCYYKVKDNIADSGFFKKIAMYLLLPYFSLKRKKAKKMFPAIEAIIFRAMAKQKETEGRVDAGVDMSAEPSAKAMAELLSLGFEGETKEKLSRFGYLVGRWVYLIDALDDMSDDRKTDSYNVFNNKSKDEKEAKDYAVSAVNLTAAQLTREFEILHPRRFGDILENIVYDGLYNSMKEITEENRREKK